MNIHSPFYSRYLCGKWPKEKSFHTFIFPDGEIIKGDDCTEYRYSQLSMLGPIFTGKSTVDIGAWNGWFSYRAEQLGASRVLATDWFCWDNGPGPGTKYIFDYVKKKLNSKVEELEIDVPDLTVERVGKFDMVMALGLFYHLPSILTSIVNLAEIARESILIESAVDLSIPQDYACSRLYIKDAYCYDPSNFFIPNVKFYTDTLSYCGFRDIRTHLFKIGEWDRVGVYALRS